MYDSPSLTQRSRLSRLTPSSPSSFLHSLSGPFLALRSGYSCRTTAVPAQLQHQPFPLQQPPPPPPQQTIGPLSRYSTASSFQRLYSAWDYPLQIKYALPLNYNSPRLQLTTECSPVRSFTLNSTAIRSPPSQPSRATSQHLNQLCTSPTTTHHLLPHFPLPFPLLARLRRYKDRRCRNSSTTPLIRPSCTLLRHFSTRQLLQKAHRSSPAHGAVTMRSMKVGEDKRRR